jgi:PAS domain S-box-containing protein
MMNILIVDDRADDRKLLRYNIERHGHSVMEAGDGQEGLELAAKHKPDLIISDALMPGMDGFQFLRAIKADKNLKDIPFVFYSATYTGCKEEELAFSLGAVAFIVKPKEPEEFWKELSSIIGENGLVCSGKRTCLLEDKEEYLEKYAGIVAAKLEEKVCELEKAGAAIAESERQYRLIAENVTDVIWTMDMNFRYTYFSPSVEKLRGFSVEEAVSQKMEDVLTPLSMKLVKDVMAKDLESEKMKAIDPAATRALELEVFRRDGSTIWTEASVSFLRDLDGEVIGILGVTRDITERKESENKIKQTLVNLKKSVEGTIQALTLAVETRDPYTAGHQKRVVQLAAAIAVEMGFPEDQVEGIRLAGGIHDLGKISVPADILSKPGRLSNVEYSLIKIHPEAGYNILKDIEFPWPIAQIVYQHHERIDGSGYPLRLKDGEILIEARIMAVADVVESMISHRPYRPALGIDAALDEISKNRGVLYDPQAVDACLLLFQKKGFSFEPK